MALTLAILLALQAMHFCILISSLFLSFLSPSEKEEAFQGGQGWQEEQEEEQEAIWCWWWRRWAGCGSSWRWAYGPGRCFCLCACQSICLSIFLKMMHTDMFRPTSSSECMSLSSCLSFFLFYISLEFDTVWTSILFHECGLLSTFKVYFNVSFYRSGWASNFWLEGHRATVVLSYTLQI